MLKYNKNDLNQFLKISIQKTVFHVLRIKRFLPSPRFRNPSVIFPLKFEFLELNHSKTTPIELKVKLHSHRQNFTLSEHTITIGF